MAYERNTPIDKSPVRGCQPEWPLNNSLLRWRAAGTTACCAPMNSCEVGSHLLIEMCHLSSPTPAQTLESELATSGVIVARFPASGCVFHGDGSSLFYESAALMQNGHDLDLGWAWLQPLSQRAESTRPLWSLGSGQHRECRFCVTPWTPSGKQKTAFDSQGFCGLLPDSGRPAWFWPSFVVPFGEVTSCTLVAGKHKWPPPAHWFSVMWETYSKVVMAISREQGRKLN